MKRRPMVRWVAVALVAVGGCGEQSVAEDAVPTAPHSLTVRYGAHEQQVVLDECEVTDRDGTPVAVIAEVVAHPFSELVVADVAADFEAGDGFRPASKDFCTSLIPVPGDRLHQGYVEVATGNLQWDEALDYPGCLHVRNVALIEVLDP